MPASLHWSTCSRDRLASCLIIAGSACVDDAVSAYLVDLTVPPPPGRRLVLRFLTTPVEVLGSTRVTGLRVERDAGVEDLAAGLVVTAFGYRGRPVPGLQASGHRMHGIELGPLPFARFQHLAQMLDGVPDIGKAHIQRREAEAQNVRTPRSP